MKHYRDNVMKFGEVYGRLWKPFGNKDNKQSTASIFFEIANAIQKKI